MRRTLEDGVSLTLERLKEVLSYNEETGAFTWRARMSKKTKVGSLAGVVMPSGYRYIKIDNQMYTSARLAWFTHKNEWPNAQVIHINGDPSDDRIANLVLQEPRGIGNRDELTRERLMEIMSYNPDTGKFAYLQAVSRRVKVGDEVGTVTSAGYRYISIDGRKYLGHRLAWFVVNGKWPAALTDHVNGNRDDNRIINLREANHAQNAHNSRMPKHNKSGLKGVSYSERRKKWHATITHDYRVHPLGFFNTKEEAHAAYRAAAIILHGDFANLGDTDDMAAETIQ